MQGLEPLNFKHLQTDSPAYAAIKQYMQKNPFCYCCSSLILLDTLSTIPISTIKNSTDVPP